MRAHFTKGLEIYKKKAILFGHLGFSFSQCLLVQNMPGYASGTYF